MAGAPKFVKLTVKLLKGSGLLAADKNGLSDPYVKLGVGKEKQTSRVIRKTLDPVWDQTFDFVAPRETMRAQQLAIDVRDHDKGLFDKDDPLGTASVPLDVLSAEAGGAQDMMVALSTQGQLQLQLSWSFTNTPAASSAMPSRAPCRSAAAVRGPGVEGATALGYPAAEGTEKYVKLTVKLLKGSGLRAADKNGLSDPYVKLGVGKEKQTSRVIKKTLDPVWDQTFDFVSPRETMRAQQLTVDVRDHDQGVFDKDDPLGKASVALDVLEAGEGAVQDAAVPLSTQGELQLQLSWSYTDAPVSASSSRSRFGLFKPKTVDSASREASPAGGAGEHLQLTVKLLQGNELRSADKNGLSDPYVKLGIGKVKKTSRVIKKTLDPVWDQTFEFVGPRDSILSDALVIDVFDKDEGLLDRDDKLGSAKLHLSSIVVGDEGREFDLPLSTKGSLKLVLEAAMTPMDRKTLLDSLGDEGEYTRPPEPKKRGKHVMPWEWMRRECTEVAFTLVLKGARGLRAADRGGKSDPYAKAVLGRKATAPPSWSIRSKTIPKTVEPVWDEQYTFRGLLRDLTERPLHLSVFDEDQVGLDDLLGRAELDLEPMLRATAVGKPLKVKLPLMRRTPRRPDAVIRRKLASKQVPAGGDFYLELHISTFATPSVPQMIWTMMRPVLRPVLDLPKHAEAFRRDLTHGTISVLLRDGKGFATKGLLSTKSHVSALVTLGEASQKTLALSRKSEPTWNEEFHFHGLLKELLSAPLRIDISLDKAKRGFVEVDISSLVAQKGERTKDVQATLQYTCPVSRHVLTGDLNMTVTVEDLHRPSWFATGCAFLEPVLAPIRALIHLPATLRSRQKECTEAVVEVLLKEGQGLKAADGRGKSDPYATLNLAGKFQYSTVIPKTVDPVWNETFVFKAESRDILAAPLQVELWDEDVVGKDDPLGSAELDLSLIVDDPMASEGIEYALPLSGAISGVQGFVLLCLSIKEKRPPSKRKLLVDIVSSWVEALRNFVLYHRMPYDRSIWVKLRDWRTLLVMVIAAAPDVFVRGGFFTFFLLCIITDREEFQLMRFILSLKGTQFISGILKALIAYYGFWQCTVTASAAGACRVDGPGVGISVGLTAALLIWLQILMWTAFLLLPYASQYDPQTGMLNFDRANLLWANNYARAKQQLAHKEEKAMEEKAARSNSPGNGAAYVPLEEEDLELGETRAARPSPSALRGRVLQARAFWMALTHPLVNASSRNRMVMLLKWDMAMFSMSVALLYIMMFFALWAAEEERAHDADGDVHFLSNVLWPLINFSFLRTWQCQITFSVVKVLFSVSSAPFFIFIIGGLNKLFTHTEPTGYTRDGQIVPADPNGLSAYLAWLKGSVLHNEVFAEELANNFPSKDNEKLRKAVRSGEQCLVTAWKRPNSALRVTRKKKADIDEVLKKIVTRESASDALYACCFPDAVLVERYLAAKEAAKKLAESEAAEDVPK